MNILVCNAGSTSLKYKLIDMNDESVLAEGRIERVGSQESVFTHKALSRPRKEVKKPVPDYRAAVNAMLETLQNAADGPGITLEHIAAVGFKTVHAKNITGTQLLNADVLKAMEDYSFIAPAHNPPYITAINVFREAMPGKPLIGVFETSFHATIPEHARTYGVPGSWREKYGIRRYGFHGASHRYVSERVAQLMGREDIKVVTCHLGGSSSLCAVKNGKSVDTSMGFSPQGGIEHNNRCGDIDPFIPLYVMEQEGLTPKQVRDMLVKESGLYGLSGVGRDLRDIEQAAKNGNKAAGEALDAFCYGIKKYIGAYAAAMEGLDAIAFAGGIGENGRDVRRKVCSGLEFLGVVLDDEKNRKIAGVEAEISEPGSKVKVFVIPTNEEIIVARECVKLLSGMHTP